jgi:hypothetical protein
LDEFPRRNGHATVRMTKRKRRKVRKSLQVRFHVPRNQREIRRIQGVPIVTRGSILRFIS